MKKNSKLIKILIATICMFMLFAFTASAAYLAGDIDNNGKVESSDARLALRCAVGLETLTADQLNAADVDGSDGVSSADARLILRAAVGLETLNQKDDGTHTHQYGAWKIERNSAKVVTGRHYRECACGEIEYVSCSYGEKVITDSILEEGYCTKTQSYKQTCTVCGGVKAGSEDGLQHSRRIVSTTASTCLVAGSRAVICDRCGLSTTEIVPILRHKPNIPKATETEDMICTVCNTVLQPKGPATPEYEILQKEAFYIQGYTVSGGVTTPLNMAITADSVYMFSSMDGVDMGIYVYKDNIYLINPEKNTFVELSDSILKMLGIEKSEITGMVSSLSYEGMPDLKDADETISTTLNGTACTAYVFNNDGLTLTVYCSGNTLLAFGTATDMTYVNSISEYVPPELCKDPGNYYEEKKGVAGMISFFADMGITE